MCRKRASLLSLSLLLILLTASSQASAAPPGTVTDRIMIDQFGYLPGMVKVAVISDPQQGFNADESYSPGTKLEIRNRDSNQIVFSGPVVAWKSGVVHDQSGDKIWWFDFSALTCPGAYYVYDPATDRRSFAFEIRPNVYSEVLRHAARMFYYQRCGVAKQTPLADARWVDVPCHLHSAQDLKCRLISAQNDAATERDLSGGWHDAGDYNKYTNFTTGTLSDLLFAYQFNPAVWGDDFGIPESGNGIPDILDEVKWELDWLLKMQNSDGSVLSKVSVTQFQATSPPSADAAPRYYGAASTSSTLSAAMSFAHAAAIFNSHNPVYATTLRNAALSAWQWSEASPNVIFTNAGFASANPEVDDYGRSMYKLCAAVYLYALTGEGRFKTYVESNYTSLHALQWTYWFSYESTFQDAVLYYTTLPGISSSVAGAIRTSKQNAVGGNEFYGAYAGATDAYRAYLKDADYVWGSNQVKCQVGMVLLSQAIYGLDPPNAANYQAAGAGYLHYLHGVNPLGLVHLTRMYDYGGDRCANEMYHSWFGDGTVFDNALTSPAGPPPGFMMGGADKYFAPDGQYKGPVLSPPMNQPVQKAYKDWNTSWPENSWQITEPAIYYQAAYLKLLATTIDQYSNSRGRGLCLPVLSGPHRGLPRRVQ